MKSLLKENWFKLIIILIGVLILSQIITIREESHYANNQINEIRWEIINLRDEIR